MKVESGYIISITKTQKGFWNKFFIPQKEIISFFSKKNNAVLFDFCEVLLTKGNTAYFLSNMEIITPSPIRKQPGNLMISWYFSSLARTFLEAELKELHFIESAIELLKIKKLKLNEIKILEKLWLQISGLNYISDEPYNEIKQFLGFPVKIRESMEKEICKGEIYG